MAEALNVAAPSGVIGQEGNGGPVWVPQMHGMTAATQRSLREAVAGPLGVPFEWLTSRGGGLPEWWLRTAVPWTWRWRLHRTARPLRLRLEAYVVCAIPTPRWSFGLRQLVGMRLQGDRRAWRRETSLGSTAADRARPYRRPKAFAWPGEGAAIPPTEGQGGAPLAWLLRCTETDWEVLAASRHRAWLRMEGWLPLVDYEEGAWLSDSLSRRQERVETAARKAAEASMLPKDWPFWYREGVNARVARGIDLQTAHRLEAWEWGPGWVRQPGDTVYYGTPGCALCTRDSRCTMCKYAESKGKTPEALITTGAAWMDEEAAEPWGGREWELRQLVRYGM